MTDKEVASILDFIDMEFISTAKQMNNDDKIKRYKHWKNEIGDFKFSDAMKAIREIIKTGYMPKTGQIRNLLEDCELDYRRSYYKIWRDDSGCLMYEIKDKRHKYKHQGPAEEIEPWLHIKYRSILNENKEKKNEYDADWEAIIYSSEHHEDWKKLSEMIYRKIISQL